MFFFVAAVLGLSWWAAASLDDAGAESRSGTDAYGGEGESFDGGENEPPSGLIASLEGLPPAVKARAIEAIVMGDPMKMQSVAEEIDALGYHDLASRIRFRADVLGG
jgi:hypothetical protein